MKKSLLRYLPVLAVAAFLAGCDGPCSKISTINAPKLTSGSADFSVVAAVGTSISAGYQSGGLVNRHQIHAFPALFAAQTGHTVLPGGAGEFTFPAVDGDGLPPLLEIKSFSPLVIDSTGRTTGNPINLTQPTPYHNLAVPGQIAADMVNNSRYGGAAFQLVYRGTTLGLTQLIQRAPTFVTFEFGANEVLGTATAGATTDPNIVGTFVPAVVGCLNGIHAALPDAKIAVFNVPSVTSIPFFTTFPPATISLTTGTPIALIGPGGTSLSPTALITLKAQALLAAGVGFPVDGYNYLNPAVPGNGQPLPDAVVLDDAEQAATNTAIFNMNASLDTMIAARPWTTKVDLNGLLNDIASNGYTVGSTHYTTAYVTGGLFSLDGVHPNDLAHAIICNALIDAVNAQWGSTIPRLVVSDYATATASRARAATGENPMPVRIDGLATGLKFLFPGNPF